MKIAMRNLLVTGMLLPTGFMSLVHADETPPITGRTPEQARLHLSIEQAYREYVALGKTASVAKLVDLDQRMRNILNERWMRDDAGNIEDSLLEDDQYAPIGVSIEHYSGMLDYSGKLLREANRIDPHSAFRSRTLFSTVEHYTHTDTSWDVPDLRAAKAYLREFPKGPFAADADRILAGAYKDVYWGLRQAKTRKEDEVDSYACVAGQLDDLKHKSRRDQQTYAKKMTDSYLRQASRLRKPNPMQRDSDDLWRRGEPSRVFAPTDGRSSKAQQWLLLPLVRSTAGFRWTARGASRRRGSCRLNQVRV